VPVQPGLAATVDLKVTEADTAEALGSGDVPTLGTPRVVALVEEATCRALEGHLDDTLTTVGMRIELTHLAPVPVGSEVRAQATLEKVEGRRLTFTAHVDNERGLVAAGKITRVIVRRTDFLERASN
jgi:fluoroacetyl-CoA thioesterase